MDSAYEIGYRIGFQIHRSVEIPALNNATFYDARNRITEDLNNLTTESADNRITEEDQWQT